MERSSPRGLPWKSFLFYQGGNLGIIKSQLLHILRGVSVKNGNLRVWKGTAGGFPDSSVGKESACNVGDPSSTPGLGRFSGEGKGYPLQYSGLENSMDCIVHGVAKSQTQLRDFHFTSKE